MGIFLGPNSGTPESSHQVAWVRIATVTGGSTINNITYDGLDTSVYRAWMLIGATLNGNDAAYLNFYWRTNGSDEVNDYYSYGINVTHPNDNQYASTRQNEGRMQISQNAGNSTREGHRFHIMMFPYVSGHAASIGNFCTWNAIRMDQSDNFRGMTGSGYYDRGATPDGFRLQPGSGQFNDYNYSLYGLLV